MRLGVPLRPFSDAVSGAVRGLTGFLSSLLALYVLPIFSKNLATARWIGPTFVLEYVLTKLSTADLGAVTPVAAALARIAARSFCCSAIFARSARLITVLPVI